MKRKVILCCLAATGLLGLLLAVFLRHDGREFAEVTGIVTLNGKPLDEVEVVFLPDLAKHNRGPHSIAYTDADGRYRIHCEKPPAEGALLGPCRVCIRDITALPDVEVDLGAAPPAPPRHEKSKVSRVPADYTTPARTPLRNIEVHRGAQTLDLEVKTRR